MKKIKPKRFIDIAMILYIVLSIKKELVKGDWISIKRKECSDDSSN